MIHYLSVLAIFKNEAHIFAEWLDHHLQEGVDHFFLVDNESTDRFREQIAPFQHKITLYERSERHAQVRIYNELLPSVAPLTEWLMPIDLDEFLYAREGTISDYLKTLDRRVAQVQVPWRFFASSYLIKQPPLVIPHFVYRWRTGHDDLIEGKSIVRSSSVISLDVHVHNVKGHTITSDGSELRDPKPHVSVSRSLFERSALICNHYVLQSKEWFFGVKAVRGAADAAKHEHVRDQQYWDERDRNEVLDTGLAMKRAPRVPLAASPPSVTPHLPDNENRPKYWSSCGEGDAISAQLGLIPDGSRVLEVGTAAGHVTRVLNEKGCHVTGIEMDPESAKLAAPFCRRTIVGNVEALDLEAALPEQFDVVLCGDVLEHLVNPNAVLQTLKRRLVPTGYLVVSMPNVAHASVRLNLLVGTFRYVEEGLLDATHLRFFTLASIIELFNGSGLEIRDLYRARSGLLDTEITLDLSRVSAFTVRQVIQDQEATAYQFVFRAIPSSRPNTTLDLRDPAFDPSRARQQFSAVCMKKAWAARHGQNADRLHVRTWAWLAFVCQPSFRSALCWLRSLIPFRVRGG